MLIFYPTDLPGENTEWRNNFSDSCKSGEFYFEKCSAKDTMASQRKNNSSFIYLFKYIFIQATTSLSVFRHSVPVPAA
jgi:hypothetical protein